MLIFVQYLILLVRSIILSEHPLLNQRPSFSLPLEQHLIGCLTFTHRIESTCCAHRTHSTPSVWAPRIDCECLSSLEGKIGRKSHAANSQREAVSQGKRHLSEPGATSLLAALSWYRSVTGRTVRTHRSQGYGGAPGTTVRDRVCHRTVTRTYREPSVASALTQFDAKLQYRLRNAGPQGGAHARN
jgi:hypothetical protein